MNYVDVELSIEQQALLESIVAFGWRELSENVVQRAEHSAFSRALWAKSVAFGTFWSFIDWSGREFSIRPSDG